MSDTPFYLIDEARLRENMRKIERLRERSGAKALLALKCFATWSAFDIMKPYMDGTTSSSLFELHLGREKFGKETHAYSVAWADHEIDEAIGYADKIIFNSLSQLDRFGEKAAHIERGLRLNPRFSTSGFDLADPARPFSRLGEWDAERLEAAMDRISGVMIHYNCENADFALFDHQLSRIEAEFGDILKRLKWVSLGGGIHFTGEDYPLDDLADRLKKFSEDFDVQVYLEPGEASITQSASLEVTVLDILDNGKKIAIVDSSIEAHMLDLLIYRETAKLPQQGEYEYQIAGKTCLAGDIFGEARFDKPLEIGDRISIADAAGYTMVKKNWFNGVAMPAIAIRRENGNIDRIRDFTYEDYRASLS
ncbi:MULTISPECIES: carboxynorspermidine decarboxylase [Thioclava]|uniref:Carboxynorspermidine/carboxyspermidine decarboxylase n=1 Tax=Thioclava nitratireducens TaxID=1915078 RepID=A0ABN4X6B6_9RHOB|nr:MULTISPECIES: carboxynorspermidine decarboxylase [Thioclava]AQS46635.1 carboxynorspermidine decarboxylase [Thioclava nitratireducens]OWY02218.1 carboxynorspermidine decarboxylase [Thioclava sp. IC9]OWY08347.1 carboxynorspermidine decarboxylase [Thioclava sp. F42-5]OWY16539.1 carboxynorspermidine decarboxylase [Thioclava sp. JM3]PWE50174.1 carboxynorspermidine decarboxylase [Thioclava sp. NG1]